MSVSLSGSRLAIATCSLYPTVYPDDVYFVDVLKRLGVQPTFCIWNDPAVDWAAFDAVLIRTVWDYFSITRRFSHGWIRSITSSCRQSTIRS